MLKIPKPIRLEDWLLLLIGATMRIDLYFVGRLALSEVISIIVVGLFLGRVRRAFRPRSAQVFFGFLGLWIFAVLLSDFVNQTQTALMLRGLARPIIIGLMFLALFVLLEGKPSAVIFLFFGLVLAGAQNAVVPTDFRAEDLTDSDSYAYFAFVYTPLLVFGTAMLAWLVYPYHRLMSAAVLITIGFLSLVGFSRTTSSMLMLSGILITWGSLFRLSAHEYWHRESFVKKGRFLLLLLVVSVFFLQLYVNFAVDGVMGERIQAKVISQTSRPTDFPLLNMFLTGRHYNISNYLMIRENPLFGTGSWPLTGNYDYQSLLLVGADINDNFLDSLGSRRGTGHSILLGGWANYGPLSVPFWVYIIAKTIRFLKVSYTTERRLFVVILLPMLLFLFAIIFNNLNSLNRTFAAMVPVLLILMEPYTRSAR